MTGKFATIYRKWCPEMFLTGGMVTIRWSRNLLVIKQPDILDLFPVISFDPMCFRPRNLINTDGPQE